MAPPPRLHSVLSFTCPDPAYEGDAPDDDTDFEFEFAFAPPLGRAGAGEGAVADDLFAHGRILPAYPVFHREPPPPPTAASTAPPSPDQYCAWAPRSAPGSPARDASFPKSASTGQARRWRLRDLVGAGGRCHSDGKEKFVFLSPATETTAPATAAAREKKQSKKPPPPPQQKQSAAAAAKKNKPVTEMDMATAHKLFYGKAGAPAGDRKHHQQPASYLPYRPGIVGFFATAHALRRSHHPY